jgi:hypothetical protein
LRGNCGQCERVWGSFSGFDPHGKDSWSILHHGRAAAIGRALAVSSNLLNAENGSAAPRLAEAHFRNGDLEQGQICQRIR